MPLTTIQKKFTQDIAKLITFAFSHGLELTFGEVYRTLEQQKIYFDTGRSKTMNSKHLNRLAVDFNIFKNGELLFVDATKYEVDYASALILGIYWTGLDANNVWGSDWDRNIKTIDGFH